MINLSLQYGCLDILNLVFIFIEKLPKDKEKIMISYLDQYRKYFIKNYEHLLYNQENLKNETKNKINTFLIKKNQK